LTQPPRVTRLDDLMSLGGPPTWRPIRAALGIGAFGVNAYSATRPGEQIIDDHDEVSGSAGGHEELYVVMRGHARFTVDGEEIDAPAGTLVFVPDPASRRVAHVVDGETVVLIVGGRRGEAFAPSGWEQSGYAAALATRGERDRALELAREAAEAHPDKGATLYNVACAEALCGEHESALAHLRRAVELEPRAVRWAAEDSDLDAIREHPDFPPDRSS
jgi:tetratricopeptide (TPR) repeat protein